MSEMFILKPNKGAVHRKKRVGAGPGSGRGSTCCKGHDGQKSRSGKKRPYMAFEGGQMPLYRRVPKRGFFHAKAPSITFNIKDLNRFKDVPVFDIQYLLSSKIVKNPQTQIYILGEGEITTKLDLKIHKISAQAREKVEKAGGSITILSEGL